MKGNIIKMRSEPGDVIKYYLPIGDDEVFMNDLLGKKIALRFEGQINCIYCGKRTRTSYAQGYCFPCYQTLPQTDDCVLRPELCQAHEGISRDMEWSEKNCLQDHYVYLAQTSAVKVGVTRHSQVPTRWIDQGAWKAIKLAKTPNRFLAGKIEVALKKHLTDKTNWRHMLMNVHADQVDLTKEKEQAGQLMPKNLQLYLIDDDEIMTFAYPVITYPEQVKSLSFDKTREYSGILSGIRGQYLMFEDQSVINMRKFGGYKISLEY